MDSQWTIATYDPEWKKLFHNLGLQIREALGNRAIRIDHVGSTSVEGLDAKPIIDIQISVRDLDDDSYRSSMEQLGFVWRSENEDKTKQYYREVLGTRRTHIHVRLAGSFSEQMTLLFRDYLREHPHECTKYAEEKRRLMKLYKHDRPKYVEGKGPVVWEILQRAHRWSMEVGWIPGRSDM